jgi:hypothetical protein
LSDKKKVLTTCTSDNSINTHKQMIKKLIVVGSKQQVLTEVTGITAVLGTFELKTTNKKMSQKKRICILNGKLMIVNNVLQFFNKQTKTIIIVDVVHHRHRSRKHGFRKRLALLG